MLNRSTPPPFVTDFGFNLPALETARLYNQTPIYSLFSNQIEVFRIEIVFPFGKLDFSDIEDSHFFRTLLAKGAGDKTAEQVAEGFENLGGFFNIQQGNFNTTFTLFGLTRFFEGYLPLLSEVVFQSAFLQEEIELAQKRSLQNYKLNSVKPGFVAGNAFNEIIFGKTSIAGQTLTPERIERLERSRLISHYQKMIIDTAYEIFVCGNPGEHYESLLDKYFGEKTVVQKSGNAVLESRNFVLDKTIELSDSVQSTVMMGKWMFNRNHPDFISFFVTNTILGGYFGSRLMKNIREEKGLTYGISSTLMANRDSGVFRLTTHLNKDKLDTAISEIHKEIEILKKIPVGKEELDTVITYMKGSILGNTNTVFDMMDKYKTMLFNSLPFDFYDKLMRDIKKVKADDVMKTANLYLNDFSTVIVS